MPGLETEPKFNAEMKSSAKQTCGTWQTLSEPLYF